MQDPVTLSTAQYRKASTYSVTLFHCTSSLSVYAVIKTYKPHLLPVVNSYESLCLFLELQLFRCSTIAISDTNKSEASVYEAFPSFLRLTNTTLGS
jgi:hypothetical protein